MENKMEPTLERMPRVPMIAPEMKIPEVAMPQELVPKLREYILTHFNDDPTKFNDAFSEFQKMRYTVCRCQADVECLCVMKRYYAQLVMMKNRFPMEPGEAVSVPFGWNDRSDVPNCVTYDDVNYELCCVMFNIAAGHAIIAMNETRSTEDSIKNAFMHFQCAAWPLQHLRDELGAAKYGSCDFEPDFLSFFIKLLLAQAQECLIEKTIGDGKKRSNVSIAKLATFASETYFELKVLVDHASISEYIPSNKIKSWKILCGVKGNLYAAISRYYLGLQSDEEKKYGERLYHLSMALDHIKEAQKMVDKDKRENLKQAVEFTMNVISQKEASARRENDFIYHERLPKAEELTAVEPASLVKPIGFDPFDRSVSGDDLFSALLPANVLKGISMYSEEKAVLKRDIMKQIEEKDIELEHHLLALQLNQINLNQETDDMRLPEELLQCSAAYTSDPYGFSELLERLANLAIKSTEAERQLTDLKKRLQDIKCPQLEEDEGYKAISLKVDELIQHHAQASTNNTELQKAIASQSEALKLLALPLNELARYICDKDVNASLTGEGIALRKMVDKVDEMKRQRMALFEALKADLENDDITSKILAEKDFTMKDLFATELKKHAKSTKLINMNCDAQVNILKALTDANANFAECRKKIVENNQQRMQKSIELVTAYQVYAGVKEKTDSATTFFNQLAAFVKKLDPAVASMETAYKSIKEKHDDSMRLAGERAQSLRDKTKALTSGMMMPPTSGGNDFRGDYYSNPNPAAAPTRQTFGDLRRSGMISNLPQNSTTNFAMRDFVPPTGMSRNIHMPVSPAFPKTSVEEPRPDERFGGYDMYKPLSGAALTSVNHSFGSLLDSTAGSARNVHMPAPPVSAVSMPSTSGGNDFRGDYYSDPSPAAVPMRQTFGDLQNSGMISNLPQNSTTNFAMRDFVPSTAISRNIHMPVPPAFPKTSVEEPCPDERFGGYDMYKPPSVASPNSVNNSFGAHLDSTAGSARNVHMPAFPKMPVDEPRPDEWFGGYDMYKPPSVAAPTSGNHSFGSHLDSTAGSARNVHMPAPPVSAVSMPSTSGGNDFRGDYYSNPSPAAAPMRQTFGDLQSSGMISNLPQNSTTNFAMRDFVPSTGMSQNIHMPAFPKMPVDEPRPDDRFGGYDMYKPPSVAALTPVNNSFGAHLDSTAGSARNGHMPAPPVSAVSSEIHSNDNAYKSPFSSNLSQNPNDHLRNLSQQSVWHQNLPRNPASVQDSVYKSPFRN